MFCKMILDYENYDETREDFLRRRHTSSPLGSTGSGGESSLSSFQGDQDGLQSPGNNAVSDEDSGNTHQYHLSCTEIIAVQMTMTRLLVTARSPMQGAL